MTKSITLDYAQEITDLALEMMDAEGLNEAQAYMKAAGEIDNLLAYAQEITSGTLTLPTVGTATYEMAWVE